MFFLQFTCLKLSSDVTMTKVLKGPFFSQRASQPNGKDLRRTWKSAHLAPSTPSKSPLVNLLFFSGESTATACSPRYSGQLDRWTSPTLTWWTDGCSGQTVKWTSGRHPSSSSGQMGSVDRQSNGQVDITQAHLVDRWALWTDCQMDRWTLPTLH